MNVSCIDECTSCDGRETMVCQAAGEGIARDNNLTEPNVPPLLDGCGPLGFSHGCDCRAEFYLWDVEDCCEGQLFTRLEPTSNKYSPSLLPERSVVESGPNPFRAAGKNRELLVR